MKEVLFKAKRVDNGEWVEGDLLKGNNHVYIITSSCKEDMVVGGFNGSEKHLSMTVIMVNPDTICQYLPNENEYDLWSGDKFKGDEKDEYYFVEWSSEHCNFVVNLMGYDMYHNEGGGEEYSNELSVIDTDVFDVCDLDINYKIGNIHD